MKAKPLFINEDWTTEDLNKAWKTLDKLAQTYGWKGYEPQIEVIGASHMLDRYSSVGLPSMYSHWSFGKERIEQERAYNAGQMGLAYEMIINSNPSVCYLLDTNSNCMQLLVLAHAAVGHSHFFKHNYLFKEWSDADSILEYMEYAQNYIKKCEIQYGEDKVTKLLDECHNLRGQGAFHYKRNQLSVTQELERLKKVELLKEQDVSVLDIVKVDPKKAYKKEAQIDEEIDWNLGISLTDFLNHDIIKDENMIKDHQENLVYFLEQHSLWLEPWQKEIVRIIRVIAQYFYPQTQTRMMNEGFAVFVQYTLITELYNQKMITDGQFLEFLTYHTSVLYQPGVYVKYYNGLNPYTLGYHIFRDIKRMCESPTEEDKKWFPNIAGSNNWLEIINDAVRNYKDESFILQYLSPKVIRDLKLFSIDFDVENHPEYAEVSGVHNDEDYLFIRSSLSKQYQRSSRTPTLKVVAACPQRRTMVVAYKQEDENPLSEEVLYPLRSIGYLWGYTVELLELDEDETITERYIIDFDIGEHLRHGGV